MVMIVLGQAAAVPMPASTSSSTRAGAGKSSRDSWQHWGGMERQLAMMKVVRKLQQEDPDGVFSRKLDKEALKASAR